MEPGQHEAIKKASYFYSPPPRSLLNVSCVVTGKRRPDWHHLDEDRTNWTYANIIPLDRSLNDQLDKRASRGLPPELYPGSLDVTALDHYRQAHFAQGYGCARLGAFLAVPPRGDFALGHPHDPNQALAFCASALLNLRPISAVLLAIDTLERSVLPILKVHRSSVTRITAARLVMELEVYFRDYGLYSEAIRLSHLAEQYLNDARDLRLEGLKARVMQHRAIALMATRSPLSLPLLNEASEIDHRHVYVEGLATDILWRARDILSRSRTNIDEARHLIRRIYKMNERKQVAPWTWAETLWTDAEWNLTTRSSKRAYDIVAWGRDVFYNAGIVPTAVLSPTCVRAFSEKYPRDLYVSPRKPEGLLKFPALAKQVLALLPEPASLRL